MKVLTRALLLSAFVIQPAIVLAADLSRKPADPATLPPVFGWAGFYVGLNAGYGDGRWGSNTGLSMAPCPCAPEGKTMRLPPASAANATFVGGGQLGYLYQVVEGWVTGVEADIQRAGMKDKRIVYPIGVLDYPATLRDRLDWYGTARLRAGYGFERVLVYGTGGLAFGRIESLASYDALSRSQSDTKAGWALGGGLEYALTDKWSVRAEYLHVDFGKAKRLVFPVSQRTDFHARQDLRLQTIRAGLNYRF